MTPSLLRDLPLLAGLALTLGTLACSSSDDAKQIIPTAGTGGTSSNAAAGGTAGASSGGKAGTGSGGTAGGACLPTATPPASAGEAGANGDDAARLPWLHVEGTELKDPSGNTVVLRGVDLIDLGATEKWEGGISRMIDRLTNPCDAQGSSPGWGTKVLRFAIVPADTDQGSPIKYAPDTNYYENILRPAVDYAAKKGLYVIIDWHYIDDTSLHLDTTNAFWSDMAPRFKDDSNVLFELYNEPMDKGVWSLTKPNMQAWYDLVREGAPDNLVLVGSPNWSQQSGDAASNPLVGTNVMYVAHMYPPHFQTPSLRDQITLASTLAPVFMTEWGFQESSMDTLLQGTVTAYGSPLRQFIEERHLSWSAWCASSSWGPPMFNKDYTLRVGEGEMGGFVKDWLYEKRNDDLPMP